MSKEMRKSIKQAGVRPGTMYELSKVHKQGVDGSTPLTPTLSVLQTPTYNFTKFSVSILNYFTKNK